MLTVEEQNQFLIDVVEAAKNEYAFKMICTAINYVNDKPSYSQAINNIP